MVKTLLDRFMVGQNLNIINPQRLEGTQELFYKPQGHYTKQEGTELRVGFERGGDSPLQHKRWYWGKRLKKNACFNFSLFQRKA